jgi:hypothetical protein
VSAERVHLYVPGVNDWAEFEIRKLDGVLACAVGNRGVVILLHPSASAGAIGSAASSIVAAAGLHVPVDVLGGATGPTATLVSAAARRPALAAAAAGAAVLALASSVAALTGRLPFNSGPRSRPAVQAAAPAPRQGRLAPPRPGTPVVTPGPSTALPEPPPAVAGPPAATTINLALAVVHHLTGSPPAGSPPANLVVTLVPVEPPAPSPPPSAPGKPVKAPPSPPSPQVLAPNVTPAVHPSPAAEPAVNCPDADDRAEDEGHQSCAEADQHGEEAGEDHGAEGDEDHGAEHQKVRDEDERPHRAGAEED